MNKHTCTSSQPSRAVETKLQPLTVDVLDEVSHVREGGRIGLDGTAGTAALLPAIIDIDILIANFIQATRYLYTCQAEQQQYILTGNPVYIPLCVTQVYTQFIRMNVHVKDKTR